MADPLDLLTMMFDAPCLLPAQKRTLWTIPSMVRPALSGKRFGAGDLLIGLMPLMHRPLYYLVWIDAKWFDDRHAEERFYDELDNIWESLEDEFGPRGYTDNGDRRPFRWPEVDDEGGCCWFIATADSILTPKARKRFFPEFDNTRAAAEIGKSSDGGGTA